MSQPHPPDPSGVVPACPRHPGRESRIRCQRCARPVCPECQRPAAVGVHCLDCVAEAERARPRTRSVFGAVVRPGRPLVTYSLVGVSVAVYVLQLVAPGVTRMGAFMPALGYYEPWRFLTAAFLHAPGQPMHILFNMFCLWQLGQILEPAVGRARFLAAYLLCALGGSVGFMWISAAAADPSSTWFVSTVGASGAVFGLFGMVLLMIRQLGGSARSLTILLLLNAALPVLVPGIAWQAHLGGFLAGALIAGGLIATRTRRSPLAGWLVLAAAAVLLGGIAVAKYLLVLSEAMAAG